MSYIEPIDLDGEDSVDQKVAGLSAGPPSNVLLFMSGIDAKEEKDFVLRFGENMNFDTLVKLRLYLLYLDKPSWLLPTETFNAFTISEKKNAELQLFSYGWQNQFAEETQTLAAEINTMAMLNARPYENTIPNAETKYIIFCANESLAHFSRTCSPTLLNNPRVCVVALSSGVLQKSSLRSTLAAALSIQPQSPTRPSNPYFDMPPLESVSEEELAQEQKTSAELKRRRAEDEVIDPVAKRARNGGGTLCSSMFL